MKYCATCGNQLHDHAVLCIKCGCAAPPSPACVHAPVPATPPAGYAAPAAPAVSAPDGREYSPKKGVAVLLLLIVLGQLGIHRMYAGKVLSGILMGLIFVAGYICLVTGVHIAENSTDFPVNALITLLTSALLMLGWLVWWIVDLVALCGNKFTDGLGRLVKIS